MKKILLITGSIIVVMLVIFGGLYWMSSPRYEIVQKERSIAIMGSKGFSISPAKVKITNLWNHRDVIIPVTIINEDGDTTFKIGNNPPARFDDGYINARTLNECVFTPDLTNVAVKSNETKTIYILISKQVKGKLTSQEIGISIEQQPEGMGKGIRVVKSNIFEILIK